MTRDHTLSNVSEKVRSGKFSFEDYLSACLQRIGDNEERVQAWVCVNEAVAHRQAKAMDQALSSGISLGPLQGIPVAVKDIFDVAGLPTLAGSELRSDHIASADAPVVRRLRAAGAIILGKTVTTQFACFDPSVTHNPWNLSHTPGGSSSGSAAAVALGMSPLALGSQTGGSITRPASYCGVVGFKPTWGTLPGAGIVPVSYHLDHPGLLARSVADIKLAFDVLQGYRSPSIGTALSLSTAQAKPPILGLLDEYFMETADEQVRQATLAAVERLRSAGAIVNRLQLPKSFAVVHRNHKVIMAVEAAEYHAPWFPGRREMYGKHLQALLDMGHSIPATEYAAALAHQRLFRQELSGVFQQVDFLITPSTSDTAPGTLETTGDPRFNSPFSYAGTPTISLPCGLGGNGMPCSLQIIGPGGKDLKLLEAAQWCESHLKWNHRPGLCV